MAPKWFRGRTEKASKAASRKSKWAEWLGSRTRKASKPLYLELLEERSLLSTTTWINAGSGNWDVGANWSTGQVPGNTEDVVINTAAAATITIQSGDNESVRSLTTSGTDTLSFTGGSLTVAASSPLSGPLLMTAGSITANGAGVTLTASAATTVSSASFIAQGGATITLPNLTHYTETESTVFEATGANSTLNVSALTSLGNMTSFWQVEAFAGGTVNLSGLATVNQPTANVQFDADGAASQIELSSSLTTFTGGGGSSKFAVTNGATIAAGALATFNDVNVVLDGTGTVSTSQWAAFTANSSVTVTGGAYSLPGLTSFDNSNFLVQNGGSLTVPNLASFKATANNTVFEATGVNSTLNLSGLTSLGNMSQFWQVEALAGGTVNLPLLSTVSQPNANIQFVADGTGSQIALSSSLTTFTGGGGSSKFAVTNGATIVASGLANFSDVNVELDGTGVVSTSQWAKFGANSSLTVTGGTYSLTGLISFDNSSFLVQSGGSLSAPNLASFKAKANNTVFEATGVGSTLNLPDLSSLGSMTQFWQVESLAGGTVDLHVLSTINQPNANILFDADGAGSQIELSPSLTTFTGGGGSSKFAVTNGASIVAGGLATFNDVNVVLDGTGTVSTNQWATFGANSSLTVTGGAYSLSGLTSFDNSSFLVQNGASLTLPNLASFKATANNTVFEATGVGSILDLADLSSLGTMTQFWQVEALAGGTVNLPVLSTINQPNANVLFNADGTDSQLNLSPSLTSFTGGGGSSQLKVTNNATLTATNLANFSDVNIILDGTGTVPASQWTSMTNGGSLTVTGGTYSLAGLTNVDSETLTVSGGGSLTLLSLTSLSNASIFDTDASTLATPQLATLDKVTVHTDGTDNALGTAWTTFTNGNLNLTGGTLTLPNLNDIADSNITLTGGSSLSLPVLQQGNLTLAAGSSVTVQGIVVSLPASGTSGATVTLPSSLGLTFTFVSNGSLTDTTFDVGQGTSLALSGGTYNGGTTFNIGQNGSVVLVGGTYLGGAVFALDQGATVDLNGGQATTYGGTLAGSGNGTVKLAGGQFRPALGGMTLNFPGNMLQWTDGSILADVGNVTNLGTINLAGSGEKGFFDDGTLDNFGTIIQTGTGNFGLHSDNVSPTVFKNEAGASYLIESDSGIDNPFGGETDLVNAGLIRKTTGNGTSTLFIPGTISNTGTIEADSGTLFLNANSLSQVSNGIFAGGTWNALGGATLELPSGIAITANAAQITLSGSGATVTGLTGLSTNSGSFTLTNGASFQTSGAFTNSGTLTVGPGSQLKVAGAETEASGGTLEVQIGGAPASGLFGQVAATGAATLGGTFKLTLVNQFTPSAGQDFKAMTYASVGGTFSSVNVGSTFTLAINPTSLDLNSTVSNPVDLSLSNASGPTSATAGHPITVSWTVNNQSSNAVTGTWQDSVYLSTTPGITSSSVLVGAAVHSGGLAANGFYNDSLNAIVPVLAPGSYFVIIQADSLHQVQDTDRSNNTLAATGQLVLSVPPITLGTPLTGSFTASNQDQYYQVTVPAGGSVVIALTSNAASGGLALYVSQGTLPTPFNYQYASSNAGQPSQTAILPQVFAAGTYYILAHSVGGAAATAGFTLSVTQGSALTVAASSTPYVGGTGGNATIEIEGTNFTPSSTASLTLGATTINAASINFVSASKIFATFNLSGAAVGSYTLKVTQGAQSVNAPTPFQVVAASAGSLNVVLSTPQFVRSGRTGTITITYTNPTQNDMVAPVLDIFSTNTSIFFSTPDDPNNFTQDTQLLAVAPSGPAGILRAGQSGTLTLTLLSEDTVDNDAIPIEVDQLQTGQPNGLAAQKAALQPSTISTSAWNVIFGNLLGTLGTTSDSFNAALAQAATYLSGLGESSADVSNVNNLWSFLVSQANATYPTATLTNAVDASLTTPGALSLAVDRSFVSSIADRNQQGIFGIGWSTAWDTSISVDTAGNAAISAAGNLSYFVLQANGTYLGTDGTNGTLTNSGGAFTLTSSSGMQYVFLPNGILSYEQDTNGNRVTLGYDAANRLSSLAYSNPANPSEPSEKLTLTYNAQGLVSQETDGTGNTWTYTYDAGSHLLSVVGPGNLTTSYTYDTGSNPETANALLSITNSDGSQQNFSYDSQGRLSGTSANGGADAIAYTYLGQAEVMSTDAANNQTIVWYNELGQPSRVEDPRGGITNYLYDADGNLTNATDAAGNTSQYSYDGNGNLAQIINPLGQTVRMTYGALDSLTSITDAGGNSTQYGYSSSGNLLSIAYPGGSQQTFTYDPLGNLSETIEQNGHPLSYQHNAQGQVSRQTFADGSSQTFTYDAHGNVLTASAFDTASTLTGTTTMTYNAANALLSITYPGGRSLNFTYNAMGQRTQSVDQSGYALTYSYDSLGRLSQLSDGAGMIVQYTYNNLGELQKKVNGNGTFTTYTYDASGNLASEVNFAGGTTVNSSFTYTYNLLDELTSMTDAANNVTTYGYDVTGQLTQVSLPGGASITYVYNAAGDRTEVVNNGTPTNYSSNSQNEIVQVGATTYTYDANGNLHAVTDGSGTTTYTYNDLNELVSIVAPDNTTTTFQYSPLGFLIGTNINGTLTNNLVDPTGLTNVVSTYTGAGSLIANYNFGLGLVSQTGPSGTGYYDFDGSGNTAGITGSGGTYVNRYSYLPFGETTVVSAALPNPFTFAGQVGVQQIGANLFSMRARNYSPATGQFLSKDPLGLAAGDTNIRRYVSNSPIQHVDPSGLTEGNGVFFGPSGFYVNIPITRGQVFDNAIAPGLVPPLASGIQGIAGKVVDNSAPNPYQGVNFQGRDDTFILIHFNFTYPTLSSLLASFGPKHAPAGSKSGHGGGKSNGRHRGGKGSRGSGGKAGKGGKGSSKGTGGSLNRSARDPNSLVGPAGFGAQGFIRPGGALPYTIEFENDGSIAAQQVIVTQQLSANLDWSTFQLGSFGFGTVTTIVPVGLTQYQTTVNYQNVDGTPLNVLVSLDFNVGTGLLTVTYTSLDPSSGQTPAGVTDGFLPPDDANHIGEGFVQYSVKAKVGLATGVTINQQAAIVFDTNPPIDTPIVTNTLDVGAPTSSVTSLPSTEPASFTLSWSGQDDTGGSGIASYNIFVSDNGGAFTPFLMNTTATSATFTGTVGHTYGFYSVATDNAVNVQPTPSSAQASTTIAAANGSISGSVFRDFNLNGQQDGGEPAIAGITVFLDSNTDGVLDTGEPTSKTNASGSYSFTGLAAGTYTVREVLFGGTILSMPSNGSFSVTVTSGSNTTGKNFGNVLTSITVPLTLPSTTPFPAQGNANADFVEAIYRAVLNRSADSGGLNSWTGNLNNGQLTRLQVVQGIRNSPEHFAQEIDVFYETLLNRTADAGGLAHWVGQLQSGEREEQIAFDFLNSPEYLGKGDKFFVDAMYQSLLGRTFDPTGEASWFNSLGDDASGNPSHAATLTHAQVINDFLFSQESLERLVEGYYEVFLQRQADPGGLKGWVTELQNGLPFLTIGQEFIASDEFYNKAAANN